MLRRHLGRHKMSHPGWARSAKNPRVWPRRARRPCGQKDHSAQRIPCDSALCVAVQTPCPAAHPLLGHTREKTDSSAKKRLARSHHLTGGTPGGHERPDYPYSYTAGHPKPPSVSSPGPQLLAPASRRQAGCRDPAGTCERQPPPIPPGLWNRASPGLVGVGRCPNSLEALCVHRA